MQRLTSYLQLYRQTPRPQRIFFWTVVIFCLMMAVPTIWTYARLFTCRTQIPTASEMHVSH